MKTTIKILSVSLVLAFAIFFSVNTKVQSKNELTTTNITLLTAMADDESGDGSPTNGGPKVEKTCVYQGWGGGTGHKMVCLSENSNPCTDSICY